MYFQPRALRRASLQARECFSLSSGAGWDFSGLKRYVCALAPRPQPRRRGVMLDFTQQLTLKHLATYEANPPRHKRRLIISASKRQALPTSSHYFYFCQTYLSNVLFSHLFQELIFFLVKMTQTRQIGCPERVSFCAPCAEGKTS